MARAVMLAASGLMELARQVDRVGSNGAMLMAVCRGKMSEGIDFADRHGRAVIVTGIPFPAYYDPRVVLKRKFMDDLVPEARSAGREPVTGEQWYVQQAARAVNQAIGRVIRHRKDYGIILLCDERFVGWTKQSLLSKWMKDKVQIMEAFGPIVGKVTKFFEMHKQAEGSVGCAASVGEDSRGQVALHNHQLPAVKARRQEQHKIATAFLYEQEYGSQHKDKKRDAREATGAGPGGGLGSWMVDLDDEPARRANTPAAAKAGAAKPPSLADRLVSMHAGAQPARQTPSHGSKQPASSAASRGCPAQAATPATVARANKISPAHYSGSEAEGGRMSVAAVNVSTTAHGGGGRAAASSVGALAQGGTEQQSTKKDAGEFMATIRQKLAKDDYDRFKKAMKGLQAADEPKRKEAFEVLHAVLNNPQTKHALEDLLAYMNRKLREQMRTHLASKGVRIGEGGAPL